MQLLMVLTTCASITRAALAIPIPIKNTNPNSNEELAFCNLPGNPCWLTKRTALAVAEVISDSRQWYDAGVSSFCTPGTSCKSFAERLAKGIAQNTSTFDPAIFDLCNTRGVSCNNNKRTALENIGAATENALTSFHMLESPSTTESQPDQEPRLTKRFDNNIWDLMVWIWNHPPPYPNKPRPSVTFCALPGTSCNKKRQSSAIAQVNPSRRAAANELIDLLKKMDPYFLNMLCHAAGGECDSIRKASDAFSINSNIKARSATLAESDIAQACFGSQGTCTLARRALEKLGEAIDAASAEI